MPELTVFPFASCLLTIALVYRYLTPLLSGGNVVLHGGGLPARAVFSFVYALVFTILYFVLGIGLALAITPHVREFVNSAEPLTEMLISGGFRLVIFQIIFFVLTAFCGKFCHGILKVNGKFNAWKAAWAPAVVVVILVVFMSFLLQRLVIQQY